MSIVDYNKKYGKSVTLDDIYGQGYSESLTSEEIFECKVSIPKKFGLEPNMPDYIYKTVAIAFAKTFALSDISFIKPFVNDGTYLTLYKKDSLSYNRKNEMSIFQKRNEQIFSFFASFFLLLFRPLKHQLKADFKPLKQA